MHKWFSNRGQIIQILIALAALCVGVIVAFPNLSVQHGIGLLAAWPILVFPAITIGLMLYFRTSRTATWESASLPQSPTAVEGGVKSNPVSLRQSLQLGEAQFQLDSCLFVEVCVKVGSYWQEGSDERRTRINLIGLQAGRTKSTAELSVNLGGAIAHGGSDTKQISTNHFIVRESSSGFQSEEHCLYQFSFSETHLYFFVVRVDAIDLGNNQATLAISRTRVNKRSNLEWVSARPN